MCINGLQASSPFPLQNTPEHLKLGLCPVTVPSHLGLWYPCPVVCSLECCYFLFWFLLPDRWELIISSSLKCLLLSWVLFLLPWQPDKRNPGRKGVFWRRVGKDIVHRVKEGQNDRNVRQRPGHTGSAARKPRITNADSPLHFCISCSGATQAHKPGLPTYKCVLSCLNSPYPDNPSVTWAEICAHGDFKFHQVDTQCCNQPSQIRLTMKMSSSLCTVVCWQIYHATDLSCRYYLEMSWIHVKGVYIHFMASLDHAKRRN